MPITLQFDHPHFPDDLEFGIEGIGRIKNHGTVEVDDDKAAAFKTSHGMTIEAAYKHNPMFTINGVKGQPKVKGDKADAPDAPVIEQLLETDKTDTSTGSQLAGEQQVETGSGGNNV